MERAARFSLKKQAVVVLSHNQPSKWSRVEIRNAYQRSATTCRYGNCEKRHRILVKGNGEHQCSFGWYHRKWAAKNVWRGIDKATLLGLAKMYRELATRRTVVSAVATFGTIIIMLMWSGVPRPLIPVKHTKVLPKSQSYPPALWERWWTKTRCQEAW